MNASHELTAEDRAEAASVDTPIETLPDPSEGAEAAPAEALSAEPAAETDEGADLEIEADVTGSLVAVLEAEFTEPEAVIGDPEADAFEPDTVEFELALQFQDIDALGFEGAVRAAIDTIGGNVLFDMPLPAEPDCRRVAAVSIGSGGERLLALVILPAEGSALRVERADRSSNPVAGIVAAYAGVMDHLAVAA